MSEISINLLIVKEELTLEKLHLTMFPHFMKYQRADKNLKENS